MAVVFAPQVLVAIPKIMWLFSNYWTGVWEEGALPTELIGDLRDFVVSVMCMMTCIIVGGLVSAWLAFLLRGGAIRPSEHEYWDSYVDLWHLNNKIINVCVKQQLLRPFMSTRWLNYVLRLVSGADIHPSALVIGDQTFRDLDLVRIGENAVVNWRAVLRTHTFEDWKLQFEYVTVKSDAVVGSNAELMAGCIVGKGADIDLSTIVNKGEVVPAGAIFAGLPGSVVDYVESATPTTVGEACTWSTSACSVE